MGTSTNNVESSAFDYSELIASIIASLRPSVELSVQNALGAVSNVNQQETTITTQVNDVAAPIAAPAPQVATIETTKVVSTQGSTASNYNENNLIAEIVATLTPSIQASVQSVLANNAAATAVNTQNTEISTVNTQTQTSESSAVNSEASSYASSSSLQNLFGDGKTLNVKFNSPAY